MNGANPWLMGAQIWLPIVITLMIGIVWNNKRFDDLNKRIDDLNHDLNKRIDDLRQTLLPMLQELQKITKDHESRLARLEERTSLVR